jgi:CRISPR-associated protein Csh2
MVIEKRSEIIFLYDIKDLNPNGDPDENKPRMDGETEINIVTDVRLKRTIRDYLHDYKGEEIFIREEIKEDGSRKTREEKLSDAEIKSKDDKEKLLRDYIDLRLFGATIAGKSEGGKGKNVFTWTGPVQFKFGRSLHKVEPVYIKGTSVLPTKEKKAGGAFTDIWILPYSLIGFYGIVNENTAQETGLSEDDIDKLLDGIWNGTKNLITRSKVGQIPRLLIQVIYKEENYHIGDLDKKLELIDMNGNSIDNNGTDGKTLRDITDFKINIDELTGTLTENAEKIESIKIEANNDVNFLIDDLKKELKGADGLISELKKIEVLKDKIEKLNIDK